MHELEMIVATNADVAEGDEKDECEGTNYVAEGDEKDE